MNLRKLNYQKLLNPLDKVVCAMYLLNQYLFLSTFKLPPQYFSIMSCIKTKIIAYICVKNKIKKNG